GVFDWTTVIEVGPPPTRRVALPQPPSNTAQPNATDDRADAARARGLIERRTLAGGDAGSADRSGRCDRSQGNATLRRKVVYIAARLIRGHPNPRSGGPESPGRIPR